MEFLLYFFVAIGASTIGAISGIGGGIIIKPVLDGIGILGIPTINFLSGCTVLAMTTVSLYRSRKDRKPDMPLSLYLAAGGVAGGILGKEAFAMLPGLVGGRQGMALAQSGTLLAVNAAVLAYVLNRPRVRTVRIRAVIPTVMIGCALGCVSSFLGIGGGPLNIAVLRIFFSMEPKQTALNSLFIIFFSQLATLASTIAGSSIPPFDHLILAIMCAGGISGAVLGRGLNSRMDERQVERLFLIVLLALLALNVWNLIRAL